MFCCCKKRQSENAHEKINTIKVENQAPTLNTISNRVEIHGRKNSGNAIVADGKFNNRRRSHRNSERSISSYKTCVSSPSESVRSYKSCRSIQSDGGDFYSICSDDSFKST